MSTRAAIYARQSVAEEQGIAQQIKACQSRIDAEGWTLANTYPDNDVSASRERGAGTAWADMLADIDAGLIDVVVCTEAPRLLRRVTDVLEVTKPKRAVRVVSVRDGVDTDTTLGKVVLTILTTLAEAEIETKEARMIPYRAARREAGHPSPGLTPYGYRWIPRIERDDKGTRYAVVGAEADTVRWMSAELLAGVSLASIARTLNERGVTTRRGARWHSSAVRDVLTSPFLAALLPPPMPKGDDGKARPYDALAYSIDDCRPGAWPAILTEDAVRAARHILGDPSRRKHDGDTRAKWLLAGIGRCGSCGGLIRRQRVKTTTPDLAGYRCIKGCFQRAADPIEAYVSAEVVRVLSEPGTLAWDTEAGDDLAALQARRAALLAKRAEAVALWREGAFTGDEYREERTRIDAEISGLDARISDAVTADPLAAFLDADDVRAVWQGLPLPRQRVVLGALAERVTVHPVGKGKRPRTLDETRSTVDIKWRAVTRKRGLLDGSGEIYEEGKVPADARAAIVSALDHE